MALELHPNPNDRILCVKVGKIKRENLYEMTRKYWVVSLEKAELSTHVCAVIDGIVAAVYIPKSWKYTDDIKHKGRCEFVGIQDVHSEYVGKDVRCYYGRSANPVKYINFPL